MPQLGGKGKVCMGLQVIPFLILYLKTDMLYKRVKKKMLSFNRIHDPHSRMKELNSSRKE